MMKKRATIFLKQIHNDDVTILSRRTYKHTGFGIPGIIDYDTIITPDS